MSEAILKMGRRVLRELGNVVVIAPVGQDRQRRVRSQIRDLKSDSDAAIGRYWRTVGGYIEYGMREVDDERRRAKTRR